MAYNFRKYGFWVISLIFCLKVTAQVSINLAVKPPFTPFLSDYTKPERLEEVTLSMFNSSGKYLRIKFRFSLTNRAKGISIILKEDVIPAFPFELKANEFRFLKLDELSGLYGSLNQQNFSIAGADIQSIILDGTLPDGIYEICLQVFDYDAPGFSNPLSQTSPTGCFTFEVNYTDPPTDIRLNSNLLQYTYGGSVPELGYNSLLGQNYTVQFTPPAMQFGVDFEYQLYIFEESSFNPTQMPEAQLKEAITSLIPYVSKTSSVPFFIINPGDPPLEFGKNYYLLIEAKDLNRKTYFKNKGFSTLKAFRLLDLQPLRFEPPIIEMKDCGKFVDINNRPFEFKWTYEDPAFGLGSEKGELITDIKIVRISALGVVPDIFESNEGHVLVDTSIANQSFGSIVSSLALQGRIGQKEDLLNTRLVFAVRNRVKPNSPLFSSITLINGGKCRQQCVIGFNRSNQFTPQGQTILTAVYPQNGDTLPFFYPPVVIATDNLKEEDKIIFTQLNSRLEPIESNKYLKITTDPEFNSLLNSFEFDSTLNIVSLKMQEASALQLAGEDNQAEALINQSSAILRQQGGRATVQITHALGAKNLPLGNGIPGKQALANNVFRYQGLAQSFGGNPVLNYPNMANFLYLVPHKEGINWTAKVGVYNTALGNQMTLGDYELKFRLNQFTSEDLALPLLQNGYKIASGSFNVGMGTPQLSAKKGQNVIKGTSLSLSFKPANKPAKLLPPPSDNNDVWSEFERLTVAQQWNLEISRKSDFSQIDTVISKRIVKIYRLSEGEGPIIADLYNSVSREFTPKDTGMFFWRVTWSNITLSENPTATEKLYWLGLGQQLANTQLAGQAPEFNANIDSFFFQRNAYRLSAVDSFHVMDAKDTETLAKPNFELHYPLEGDTIPFYYPPVVIRKLQADTSWDFALSVFNSNLEPFVNVNYFVFDSLGNAGQSILNTSFDSMVSRNKTQFDALALQEFSGEDIENFEAIKKEVIGNAEKKKYLQVSTLGDGELIPLGNSGQGKLNLMKMIATREAGIESLDEGVVNPETPSLAGIIYTQPFKEVTWKAGLAYYTEKGTPNISPDSFELQFQDGSLLSRTNLSPSLQNGLAQLQGRYTVGMKTPELVQTLHGNDCASNSVQISFRPSAMPQRVFPQSGTGTVWEEQWSSLFAAQQWNIEVAKDASFDSMVYVKSHAIIESYSLPGSQSRVMNDFYTPRNETLDSLPIGKYFYRITWSNPTAIDTNVQLHKSYFDMQVGLLRLMQLYDDTSTLTGINDFQSLKRINYRFSAVDSFVVVDSLVQVADTPVCGLGCIFPTANISRLAFDTMPRVGQVMDVGQFKMKILSVVRISPGTFNGSASIQCAMFPRPVLVKFRQAQFNRDGRMISGTARAQYKASDLLGTTSEGTNSGFSLFDDFKNKYLNDTLGIGEYYDFINGPACLLLDELSTEPIQLPYGLSKTIDNFPYTLAITDLVFTPEQAKMNVASLLEFTAFGYNQILGFGATDICLGPKGLADISQGGALDLLGTMRVQITDSTHMRFEGRETDTSSATGTRLIWDCNGFKQLDIKVSLEIGRDLIIPRANGKVVPGKVFATGFASVSSLQNWMLQLDFDRPFESALLPDFEFKADHATLDFSSSINASTMVFPPGYQGSRGNDWQGIYFEEFSMKLPNAFSGDDTIQGIGFSARNMLMDPSGLTVNIGVDNLIDLDSGSLAGWKFSIDRFSFEVVSGAMSASSFVGKLGAPVFEEPFDYNLLFSSSSQRDSIKMNFTLTNLSSVDMPSWFAHLDLEPSSKVQILGNFSDPNSWMLESNFNGSISLGNDEMAGLKNIDFGTLPFEGLKLRTSFTSSDSFRVSLATLGGVNVNRLVGASNAAPGGNETPITSTGDQKVAGMGIQIIDPDFKEFEGKCLFEDPNKEAGRRFGLQLGIRVIITNEESGNGVSGKCNFGLFGSNKKKGKLWDTKFAGVNVDTIQVAAQLSGVVSITGGIAFVANDPVYGNAVSGLVEAKFPPAFSLAVSAIFGEKSGMQYWMVGAGATFPGIPIDFSANVIYANSFKGEAWFKMDRIPGDAADVAGPPRLGQSLSGASFIPANSEKFGFGAMLGITGPQGSPLFGEVGLFAQINDYGGLSKLSIEGNLWMTTEDKTTAPVFINGNTTIDLGAKRLTGKLTALVNVGNGAVRGRTVKIIDGRNYYEAGNIDLLVNMKGDSPEWHIKMGNPFITNSRLGFAFYEGSKSLFEAGGYFLMGNKLPRNLPPIPSDLAAKLSGTGINIPSFRGSNTGNGFVIMMGVDANIPEKKVEMGGFYAGLQLHFAMDGLLEPRTLNCSGRNGMAGWYMTGQAYAYSKVALGMHVDLPIFKGDLVVAELDAGMILNAGMMNPYSFNGQFTANFTALGGLIDGTRRFQFELNEDPNCAPDIPKQNASIQQLVSSVTPIKGATEVIVGVEPRIELNFPLDQELSYETGTGGGRPQKMRLKASYIRIREGALSTGPLITSTFKKVDDGLTVQIQPQVFLKDAKTIYRIEAKFYMQRFKYTLSYGLTGTWVNDMEDGGTWDTTLVVQFTSEEIASFREEYIVSTTPIQGENFFKRGDNSEGKIVFTRADVQSRFFSNPVVGDEIRRLKGYFIYYGLFTVAGDPSDTFRTALRFGGNQMAFDLPPNMGVGKLYQFRLIREKIPGSALAVNQSFDGSGLQINREIIGGGETMNQERPEAGNFTPSASREITYTPQNNPDYFRKQREAKNVGDPRILIHAFVFKVSKYATMQSKLAALQLPITAIAFSKTNALQVDLVTDEAFEQFELLGYTGPSGASIAPTAFTHVSNSNVDDNPWLIDFYRPKVYKAGDSLWRKRSLSTRFYDISRQLNGASFLLNEHIKAPLPKNTASFKYDLRLADSRLSSLKIELDRVQFRSGTLGGSSDLLMAQSSGLSIDPRTGQITQEGSFVNGYTPQTVQSTSPTTTAPALGTRLSIDYSFIPLCNAEHQKLMDLSIRIISTNPSYWMIGLTRSEINLVNRVIAGNQPFEMPSGSDNFVFGLHPLRAGSAPAKKISIHPFVYTAPATRTYTQTNYTTSYSSFNFR